MCGAFFIFYHSPYIHCAEDFCVPRELIVSLPFSEHDETLVKWRWQAVKQVGVRPSTRSGMSVTTAPNGKVFLFGGVQDVKEEDEELEGSFFNDLYSLAVEGEKATWSLSE